MIAVTEIPGSKTPGCLLRGKEPLFWKQQMFHSAPFITPENLSGLSSESLDFLIVLNPSVFPIPRPGAVENLLESLKSMPPETAEIFSVSGEPFYIYSRRVLAAKLRHPEALGEWLIHGPQTHHIVPMAMNTHEEIQTCDYINQMRRAEEWVVDYQIRILLENGVRLDDYSHFYLEGLVPVGEGTRIGVNVVITGESRIGRNVVIGPNTVMDNAVIEDDCHVLAGSIISDSRMEKGARIGPYTHLRMGSLVCEGAKMGNFVEMKKSVLGKGSKSMHLTYIGDASIGENVNIGAGTITCNYDGVNKNPTVIEDNVFVGSGTELVAPVTLHKNSYVAAGSTITESVPPNSLAVARQKQRNLIDWVLRKRKQGDLKKCNLKDNLPS